MTEWIDNRKDATKSEEIAERLIPMMEACNCPICQQILELKHYLIKKSIWIIGGDGWAYDIGFGGLDHVIASGKNVNILVLDTEVYSNTGGEHPDRRRRQIRVGRQARPQERPRSDGNDL